MDQDAGEVEVVSSGPPPRRGVLPKAAAAVLVLAVAGGVAAFVLLKGTGDVIDRLIPSSANIYVTAYLDPAAGQKVNLIRLADKFPALKDSNELDEQIDQALDEGLRDIGVTAADVRPWLGSQIAVAARLDQFAPSVAVVIASKDDGAARETLDKARREAQANGQTWTRTVRSGQEVFVGNLSGTNVGYMLIDHAVVVANSPTFLDDVIATSQGRKESLSSSSNYGKTVDALPDERLGLAYVDLRSFVEQFSQIASGAGGDPDQIQSSLDRLSGFAAALSAEPDGIALDFVSGFGDETPGGAPPAASSKAVLSYVPSSAFGVAAATAPPGTVAGPVDLSTISDELPEPLRSQFEELDRTLGLSDAISHLTGGLAIEVGPGVAGPVPGAGVVIGIDDAQAFRSFLEGLAGFAVQELVGPAEAGRVRAERVTHRGVEIVSVPIPELALMGFVPAYAVTEDAALVGTSIDEVKALLDAKASGEDITTAATFRRAIGSEPTGFVYADVQGIAAALRESLGPSEQLDFDTEVAPNLRPIKAFVVRPRGDALRLFVLIP